MKEDKKVVITGTMIANIVSVLSVLASIVILIIDENKTSGIIFLVSSLLWLFFNILNNKNKKK